MKSERRAGRKVRGGDLEREGFPWGLWVDHVEI